MFILWFRLIFGEEGGLYLGTPRLYWDKFFTKDI